jgi:hypothetical protein
VIQFGQGLYSITEDCTGVISVSRTGDTSLAASVDYATQSGTASDRSDFHTAGIPLIFSSHLMANWARVGLAWQILV